MIIYQGLIKKARENEKKRQHGKLISCGDLPREIIVFPHTYTLIPQFIQRINKLG